MANYGLDESGLQNGFLKIVQDKLFQIVKFGFFEIFEILHKCCCNTKFLQEIAFFYLVRVFLSCYSINLGSISSSC